MYLLIVNMHIKRVCVLTIFFAFALGNELQLSNQGEWKCGITRPPQSRIVDGRETFLGSHPYMVALKYWIAWRFGMGCGGCLISNTFVVTAAHCVVDTLEGSYFKPRLWAVRVGACDLANPFEKIIEYGIEQVIMHSKFNRRILANDIALIKTNMPISFNAHVSPICLPTDAMFFNQDFVGKPAVVLGWGRTRYGGPLSHVLKEAILPIVSLEKCRKSYSTVFRGFELTDGVICAGNGSADACQSDSGGPLIFQENRDGALVSSLVGIVSFGKECNNPEYPGVYTRVVSYMDWILNNTGLEM